MVVLTKLVDLLQSQGWAHTPQVWGNVKALQQAGIFQHVHG